MITIETDRIYCIYVRTSRRIRWQYSECCGRYKTIGEAIERAKERMGNQFFEYRIEELGTNKSMTGFANRGKHG